MLTARGWWCVFAVSLTVLAGVLRGATPLTVTGLALLLWFGWNWLAFSLKVSTVLRRLRVEREVHDERGPVSTLWAGRTFRVVARLVVGGKSDVLRYLQVADPIPFGVEFVRGQSVAQGEVWAGQPLEVAYTFRCPRCGVARFEGLRVEMADLHGFFYHVTFLRQPLTLRILPRVMETDGLSAVTKEHNEMLPPGVHRLRAPGSGSELLDLRDYQPGDPPRTIAWKLSARRDKLITREYESEVPVRCTLFLDTSSSVRVPSPVPGRRDGPITPLQRLVDIAAAVIRANTDVRDLTGLCLFDESSSTVVRPDRGRAHQARMLQLLSDAAALSPTAGRVDPDGLTRTAYALAEDVYPDLLRPEINATPFWPIWVASFPLYRRRWNGLAEYLHHSKRGLLILLSTVLPLLLSCIDLYAFLSVLLRPEHRGGPSSFFLTLFGTSLVLAVAWLSFFLFLMLTGRLRRLARWRKKLAALLAVQHGLGGDGLGLLLEDDDAYSELLQAFLAEHQVPYTLPLYDDQGTYQFACPGKVGVLAKALLQSVGRGRDNELYVLCADLLELDGQWEPLLQAVRVARARHHQVVLVCPWPPGLPLPAKEPPAVSAAPGAPLRRWLEQLTTTRYHNAYARLRRAFVRLGVPVVCAAGDEAVPLILDRMDRLRKAWRAL